jgi:hypothetical protein
VLTALDSRAIPYSIEPAYQLLKGVRNYGNQVYPAA